MPNDISHIGWGAPQQGYTGTEGINSVTGGGFSSQQSSQLGLNDSPYFQAFSSFLPAFAAEAYSNPMVDPSKIGNIQHQGSGGMPNLNVGQYNSAIQTAQDSMVDTKKGNIGALLKGGAQIIAGAATANPMLIGGGIGTIGGEIAGDIKGNKYNKKLGKRINQLEAQKQQHIGMYNTKAQGYYGQQASDRYTDELNRRRQQQFMSSLVPQQGYSLL